MLGNKRVRFLYFILVLAPFVLMLLGWFGIIWKLDSFVNNSIITQTTFENLFVENNVILDYLPKNIFGWTVPDEFGFSGFVLDIIIPWFYYSIYLDLVFVLIWLFDSGLNWVLNLGKKGV